MTKADRQRSQFLDLQYIASFWNESDSIHDGSKTEENVGLFNSS